MKQIKDLNELKSILKNERKDMLTEAKNIIKRDYENLDNFLYLLFELDVVYDIYNVIENGELTDCIIGIYSNETEIMDFEMDIWIEASKVLELEKLVDKLIYIKKFGLL